MATGRKAYTNEIIDRRLKQYESAGAVDALELMGLHDELSRVERKWIEKFTGAMVHARPRPLANHDHINARFERLTKLVDAALRSTSIAPIEREHLNRIATTLRARTPLKR